MEQVRVTEKTIYEEPISAGKLIDIMRILNPSAQVYLAEGSMNTRIVDRERVEGSDLQTKLERLIFDEHRPFVVESDSDSFTVILLDQDTEIEDYLIRFHGTPDAIESSGQGFRVTVFAYPRLERDLRERCTIEHFRTLFPDNEKYAQLAWRRVQQLISYIEAPYVFDSYAHRDRHLARREDEKELIARSSDSQTIKNFLDYTKLSRNQIRGGVLFGIEILSKISDLTDLPFIQSMRERAEMLFNTFLRKRSAARHGRNPEVVDLYSTLPIYQKVQIARQLREFSSDLANFMLYEYSQHKP